MKLRIVSAIVATAVACGSASYCIASTMNIPGFAPCRRLDQVGRELVLTTLKAYMDDDGNAYIRTDDTPDCRGFIGARQIPELQKAIGKFSAWSAVAAKNKVEVDKDLAKFVQKGKFHEYGIWLRFIADTGGTNCELVMKIVDFEHEYIDETVVIDAAGVDGLTSLLARIPDTMSELKKKTANEALFK